MLGGISIHTILNKIAIAVILLVVVLFSVDKSILLGFNYVGIIPFVCYGVIISYISKVEKKSEIDKRIRIISWICFYATVIIGWLLIISFPEIFNTYGI
ncbi:hypothetical protein [Oceanobacillus senegalensis]|uniref:hypothetical protein n=1 Tax=Oceanobacillus senegalensis TaxID=1936063 RepID=UPI001C4F990B|nr:hypothetical protein [Oceanobacillus senegalensis]